MMKRFATAALAAATMIAPLAAPSSAAADPPRWDRGDNDGRWDNNDNRNSYRDGRQDQRRHDRRDDRRDNRWDRSQHNGYSYNGRWYYGPPPQAYYGRYQPGYRSWRRGDRLPAYYRDNYREVDWRRSHLRAPPRGYHWVRDDRGEYLLVALTTGLILGAIIGNNY